MGTEDFVFTYSHKKAPVSFMKRSKPLSDFFAGDCLWSKDTTSPPVISA